MAGEKHALGWRFWWRVLGEIALLVSAGWIALLLTAIFDTLLSPKDPAALWLITAAAIWCLAVGPSALKESQHGR